METVEYVETYGKEYICDGTGGKFDRDSGFILIPVYFQQSDGSYGPNPEYSSNYAFPPYCTEVLEGPILEEQPQLQLPPPQQPQLQPQQHQPQLQLPPPQQPQLQLPPPAPPQPLPPPLPSQPLPTKVKKSKRFTCDLCDSVFTQLYNLERHVEDIHNTPAHIRYVCTGCGCQIKRKDNLIQHQRKGCVTVKRIPCPVCNKRFTTAGCMRRHIKTVHNKSDIVSCEQCGYETAYKHQLKSHQRLVHGSRAGMYVCVSCEIDCLTRYGLNQHVSEGRCGMLDMVCIECRIEFRSKKKMAHHKDTVHGPVRYNQEGGGESSTSTSCFDEDVMIVDELLKLCAEPNPW
eukprot:sb/3466337/